VRTAPTPGRPLAADLAADPAFDDALARIAQLTARLHAVADLHAPRRTLLGTSVCRSCARSFPCPTARASGTTPVSRPQRER
jgi:hypothetical protein